MGGAILLAVTFAAMWALFIVPQQRRVRAHRALVAALVVGEEVMTTSGLYGTITAIGDDTVELEAAPGITLTLARGAIARRLAAPGAADAGSHTATADTADADDDAVDVTDHAIGADGGSTNEA